LHICEHVLLHINKYFMRLAQCVFRYIDERLTVGKAPVPIFAIRWQRRGQASRDQHGKCRLRTASAIRRIHARLVTCGENHDSLVSWLQAWSDHHSRGGRPELNSASIGLCVADVNQVLSSDVGRNAAYLGAVLGGGIKSQTSAYRTWSRCGICVVAAGRHGCQ
jgi:hypothetical protein